MLGLAFLACRGTFVGGEGESGSSGATSDAGGSDSEAGGSTTHDSSGATTTDTSWSGGDATTTTSDTSNDSAGTTSTVCAPVDVPIEEPFEAGETRTLHLDFDAFPAEPGQEGELCLTFTSNNEYSARTILIGGASGENLGFGPCGDGLGPAPGPFTICAVYTEPEGLTEVIVDNSPPGPGCQNGTMGQVVLRFGCVESG